MPALAASLLAVFLIVRGWRFVASLLTGRG
jgi:hypothetical protein